VLNAGTQTLTVNAAATANYNAATKSSSISVAKADPTITWPTPASIVYGTPLSSTQLNATSTSDGALTYNPAAGTVLKAGTQTLTVTQASTANFNAAAKSLQVQVTKKSATPRLTAANKVFDTTATATITSCTLEGIVAGDTVTCNATGGSFDSAAVGSDKTVTANVSVAGTDSGNYTVPATATTKASITAWSITGFYQPVTLTPPGSAIIYNTVKGGSTVPLKFNVYAGGVEQKTTSAIQGFTVFSGACTAQSYEDPVDFVTTGGTSLRYDTTAGQFIQNWKTPTGASQCLMVVMTAADGTPVSAYFKTK